MRISESVGVAISFSLLCRIFGLALIFLTTSSIYICLKTRRMIITSMHGFISSRYPLSFI
uniref:Uncharacterized protein n=1 Tax=Octopus bimaculoides TaxID=37653 RepID=A0A0L8HLV5_OCTBM